MAYDQTRRQQLAALVRQHGYEHRPEAFRLSSGGMSHDYVDGKHAVADGAALRLAAEAALELLGTDWDAVGGPTMGADALAHAMAVVSGKGWFSVRKEPKGHGRESWVEGTRLQPGQRVIAVEDVSSTGRSLLDAMAKVRDLGVEVVAATALLDRSPRVQAAFDEAGIAWRPLLRWDDLGIAPL
jgi:orotate phosphoribosyltransferase